MLARSSWMPGVLAMLLTYHWPCKCTAVWSRTIELIAASSSFQHLNEQLKGYVKKHCTFRFQAMHEGNLVRKKWSFKIFFFLTPSSYRKSTMTSNCQPRDETFVEGGAITAIACSEVDRQVYEPSLSMLPRLLKVVVNEGQCLKWMWIYTILKDVV